MISTTVGSGIPARSQLGREGPGWSTKLPGPARRLSPVPPWARFRASPRKRVEILPVSLDHRIGRREPRTRQHDDGTTLDLR